MTIGVAQADASYVNFTDPDLGGWQRAYGPNADRLAEVGRRDELDRFFIFPQTV